RSHGHRRVRATPAVYPVVHDGRRARSPRAGYGGCLAAERASEAARHSGASVRFGWALGRCALCRRIVGPVGAQRLAVGGVHDADPHTDAGHGRVNDAARLPSSRPRCRSREHHGYVLPAQDVHQRRVARVPYRALVIARNPRGACAGEPKKSSGRCLLVAGCCTERRQRSRRTRRWPWRLAAGGSNTVPPYVNARSRRPASFGHAHGADEGCPAPGPGRGTAFRVDGSTSTKLRRPSLVK
ncbi:MAG: hypothetical protein QOD31_1951, partial [Pseudonocardiales bacterium]|nr:hypothetical protein [Pseudonocardiales bacterium]